MRFHVAVGVLVRVHQLEAEVLDLDLGAHEEVLCLPVLAGLHRVARLARLLHAAALEELARLDACTEWATDLLHELRYRSSNTNQ